MPVRKRSVILARARPRPARIAARARGKAAASGKLDTPVPLIAPAQSLLLPSLEGVQSEFEVCEGLEQVLPLVEALIQRGRVNRSHFEGSCSTAEVLEKAVLELVKNASAGRDQDAFSVEFKFSDRLDEGPGRRDCLFFIWGNTDAPQYIPLQPIFDQLAGNPQRERLMASLYHWLLSAASRVFIGFGWNDANYLYRYRQESYLDAREAGEDVDLEGEVEFADPAKVMPYIRQARKLRLREREVESALAAISSAELRTQFARAYRIFQQSRRIRLPKTTPECQLLLDDAAYYMDGSPIPALCVSHDRSDAIVAWLDDYCEGEFNSGVSPRAPIIRCFLASDTKSFLAIIAALPKMVETVLELSRWVRFAEEMEREHSH